MRLELGSPVQWAGMPFGELVDVVIDPDSRHVTHLVVQPEHRREAARLVPIGRARPAGTGISVDYSAAELERLTPLRESAHLRLGEFEVRRSSVVTSADGHHLGHVDGFVVDDELVTGVVLKHGHLWGRREIVIPYGAVARVKTDSVALSLTKDQVGVLEEYPLQRWY